MSTETHHPDGRRTIGLFIPFKAAGVQVAEITFEPCTFGHLLRWQAGLIPSSLALLQELSKRSLHEIESIRHPDDSRVMAAFLDHIHPDIAADVRSGVRPAPGGNPAPMPQTPATDDPGAFQEDSASGPLSGYDEFETIPPGRPSDYVEGLDD